MPTARVSFGVIAEVDEYGLAQIRDPLLFALVVGGDYRERGQTFTNLICPLDPPGPGNSVCIVDADNLGCLSVNLSCS